MSKEKCPNIRNLIFSEIITRWGKQECLHFIFWILSKNICSQHSILYVLLVVDASKMPSARSLLQSMHSMIKNVLRLAHFTCSLGGCPPISQHTSKNFFFVTFHEVPNSNCSIVRTSGKFTIRWAKTISEKQRKQNISIEIY